ncbi:hypothetical protein [Rossellomorea marisflavi]|uniref:hypothetical protein n=1 Tax=Rossellomorea marisflavi TaxID=189381 RepID=UPI001EE22895|nr:hypothetical protein [Rossellomorea marisflavi]UKS64697.1 hypothetical protein K6T23_18260 [Rossellomorea marisflavi]
MNFDTKYLVRWGIPGWVLMILLVPYLCIFTEFSIDGIQKGSNNLVAIVAFLTLIGVPIGYMMNQIHHALTWVFVRHKYIRKPLNCIASLFKRDKKGDKEKEGKENWEEFFQKELEIDEFLHKKNREYLRERYRYLLSKKHELGGLTVSLFLVNAVIGFIIWRFHYFKEWSWWYFSITSVLFCLTWMSRQYSSRNIDRYFEEYHKRAKKIYKK